MPTPSNRSFSLPKWRWTRWLTDPGSDVPRSIRAKLVSSLFATLPVFLGGVLNTVAVALIGFLRVRSPVFLFWLALEALLCGLRCAVQFKSNRAARAGQTTPTDLHMLLALGWAASVGFGAFLGLTAGDWIVATLACTSAAAMAGGICFRNFGAPRYACAMILLSLGPICLGALVSEQKALLIAFIQIPLYAFAMTSAAFQLNRILVSTMHSDQQNAKRARHDALTGLLNRAGLEDEYYKSIESPLCIFYLDLDLFKSVNDLFGHAAGDHVLRSVADRLKYLLCPKDRAGRMGGDEFVLMARDIDELAARRLANRLVQEVGERPFALPSGEGIRIGVSIGVVMVGGREEASSFDSVVAIADRALYEAKESGRSQFRFSRPVDLINVA